MKNLTYKALLAACFWAMANTSALAQPGTVDLKDGTNTVIGTYASIGSAYAAIPATLTQPYIIELKSGYTSGSESYPILLTAKAGASAANTITIRPEAGVTAVTISGTTGSSSALIKLDDADWINIDGRPGGVGTTRALTLNQQGSSSTAYGIWMINGACNNNIRWCNLNGFTSGSSGNKLIYINTSATNPSGNSNNSFEHLKFTGARYYINSSGTAANKNNQLRVYGCEFVNINFAGFWGQNGTGHVTLDSNFFYSTTASGTSSTGIFGILYDFQIDTVIITRNWIYNMDNSSYTTTVYGMCFRSANPGTVYTRIVNNFIALTAPNPGSKTVCGIEYGTNSAGNPIVADIHFNSILIGGASTGGTAGSVNSTAFSFDATNSGSTFNISNNLFANERSGGVGHHVGIAYTTNNSTLNLHDNTYDISSGNIARVLGVLYTSLAAYQSAVSSETNSNTTTINFVSDTDLHLTGSSIGNPALTGSPVPGITTDIDGNPRVLPYRGAHEAAPPVACTGTPDPATITGPVTPPCAGADFTLSATGQSVGIDISYYWQSRPAGSSDPWTNISGATTPELTTSTTTSMEYRFVDSCAASNLTAVSNVLTVNPSPLPTVSSISETHSLLAYDFTGTGITDASNYSWHFGDGATAASATASHTYEEPGSYTVMLIVSNDCGADTATLNISASPCVGAPASQDVFVSDAAICPGDTALLHVIWASLDLPSAPYLDVQWQNSADGITGWTDIPGAVNDTLYAVPSDTTYYRYILTCGGSGMSTMSFPASIAVLPAPSVSGITETHTGAAYTFTATDPQNVDTYLWDFGDGSAAVAGTAVQSHTYTSSGAYTVSLIVTGACGTDTIGLIVTPAVGVATIAGAEGISLYPNPAQSTCYITSSSARLLKVSVINAVGAVVLESTADRPDAHQLNVKALPAGSYIIRLQTNKGLLSLPLQKR